MGLVLVAMIFLRMIWVQLRTYPLIPTTIVQESLLERTSKFSLLCIHQQEESNAPLDPPKERWLEKPVIDFFWSFSCKKGIFSKEAFLRYNQNLLFTSVVIALMAARLLAGGWMMPLFIGVILMSRGRWITQIGYLNADMLINALFLASMTQLIHYLRTGWQGGYLLCMGWFSFLTLADPSFIGLFLALPSGVLLWRLTRGHLLKLSKPIAPSSFSIKDPPHWRKLRIKLGLHREMHHHPLGPAQEAHYAAPLALPYASWVLFDKRWRGVLLISLGGGLASALALVFLLGTAGFEGWQVDTFMRPSLKLWLYTLMQMIDLDLAIAGVVIGSCLFIPRSRALPSLNDVLVLFALMVIFLVIFALGFDLLDAWVLREEHDLIKWAELLRAKRLISWLEPFILTLGYLGILNIFKFFDSFLRKNE